MENMPNSLVLYNVTENESGDYKCHGTFYNKTDFNASAVILVGGKLALTVPIPSNDLT